MLIEAKHLSSNSTPRANKFATRGFDSPAFRATLLRWYRGNGRDNLPWRHTRDPYAILVSEFMLQQTQVTTVLPHYNDWLRRFPSFESVARAAENDILHAWQGLGYYSRARHLHAAAKIVTTKYHGRLSRQVAEIAALPGIGRYTANAIASFAFDRAVPVVDANIARAVARLFNLRRPIDTAAGRDQLWKKAALLLPARGARDYNSALMDLGALICVARQPRCNRCPVRRFCRAKDPNALPVKKPRLALVRITENHSFNFCRGRVLLEKSRGRWRSMWLLPRVTSLKVNQEPLHVSAFSFTHHRVTLMVYGQSKRLPIETGERESFSLAALEKIPMPTPHRHALNQLLAARSQKLCSSFPRA